MPVRTRSGGVRCTDHVRSGSATRGSGTSTEKRRAGGSGGVRNVGGTSGARGVGAAVPTRITLWRPCAHGGALAGGAAHHARSGRVAPRARLGDGARGRSRVGWQCSPCVPHRAATATWNGRRGAGARLGFSTSDARARGRDRALYAR